MPVLLHIDNSEDDIFLFRRALDKSGLPWSLKSLDGGQAALDYLESVSAAGAQKPNLVLVDLKMPIVSGFGVLEWLRAHMPQIPAVVVSSSELRDDKERAERLGAAAYLPKKLNFEMVVEFIRDQLS